MLAAGLAFPFRGADRRFVLEAQPQLGPIALHLTIVPEGQILLDDLSHAQVPQAAGRRADGLLGGVLPAAAARSDDFGDPVDAHGCAPGARAPRRPSSRRGHGVATEVASWRARVRPGWALASG